MLLFYLPTINSVQQFLLPSELSDLVAHLHYPSLMKLLLGLNLPPPNVNHDSTFSFSFNVHRMTP